MGKVIKVLLIVVLVACAVYVTSEDIKRHRREIEEDKKAWQQKAEEDKKWRAKYLPDIYDADGNRREGK
jgi:cell division protein FtsL